MKRSFIINNYKQYTLFCNSFISITAGKIESLIDVENINLGKTKSYKKFISTNKKKNSDMEFFILIYEI